MENYDKNSAEKSENNICEILQNLSELQKVCNKKI